MRRANCRASPSPSHITKGAPPSHAASEVERSLPSRQPSSRAIVEHRRHQAILPNDRGPRTFAHRRIPGVLRAFAGARVIAARTAFQSRRRAPDMRSKSARPGYRTLAQRAVGLRREDFLLTGDRARSAGVRAAAVATIVAGCRDSGACLSSGDDVERRCGTDAELMFAATIDCHAPSLRRSRRPRLTHACELADFDELTP